MTITITAAEARELLTRAVEEKGADYVYPRSVDEALGCAYFEDDGTPSCIVGHVLAYKGVTLETLPLPDFDNNASVWALQRSGFLEADDRASEALRRAQGRQDGGGDWGEALSIALRVLDGDE